MKSVQCNKIAEEPVSWENIPYGVYYRQTLEHSLKTLWPKVFGLYLLKIGALSTDLDTRDCNISYQLNVGLEGKNLQVIADPYQLPFINKSADVCLLAHTLSYISEPNRLLQEVDRVLIDDGWLIITTFNLVSILGLSKICPIFFRRQPYRSRMYTQIQLLDWLGVLNFEILYRTYLPWQHQIGKQLITYFPTIGCLCIIVARKRTLPLSLMSLKSKTILRRLLEPVNISGCYYQKLDTFK